jgi:WD40 repeat protein
LTAIKRSRDKNIIYATNLDGFIKLYSIRLESIVRQFSLSNLQLTSVSLSPMDNDNDILCCDYGGWMYIYSTHLGRHVASFDIHTDACFHVSLDTWTIVTVSWDGLCCLHQLQEQDGKRPYLVAKWETQASGLVVVDAVWVEQGNVALVVVGDDGGTVYCLRMTMEGHCSVLWKVGYEQMTTESFNNEPVVKSVAFDASKQHVAIAWADTSRIRVHRVADGNEVAVLDIGTQTAE